MVNYTPQHSRRQKRRRSRNKLQTKRSRRSTSTARRYRSSNDDGLMVGDLIMTDFVGVAKHLDIVTHVYRDGSASCTGWDTNDNIRSQHLLKEEPDDTRINYKHATVCRPTGFTTFNHLNKFIDTLTNAIRNRRFGYSVGLCSYLMNSCRANQSSDLFYVQEVYGMLPTSSHIPSINCIALSVLLVQLCIYHNTKNLNDVLTYCPLIARQCRGETVFEILSKTKHWTILPTPYYMRIVVHIKRTS